MEGKFYTGNVQVNNVHMAFRVHGQYVHVQCPQWRHMLLTVLNQLMASHTYVRSMESFLVRKYLFKEICNYELYLSE